MENAVLGCFVDSLPVYIRFPCLRFSDGTSRESRTARRVAGLRKRDQRSPPREAVPGFLEITSFGTAFGTVCVDSAGACPERAVSEEVRESQMAKSRNFFEEFEPHTRHKLLILEHYFESWGYKLGLRQGAEDQLLYV